MRRDAEFVVKGGGLVRIVSRPQLVLEVAERFVEIGRRQAERDGVEPHQSLHQPLQRIAIADNRLAEAGQILGPAIEAAKAPINPCLGMVGRQVARHEQRLVEVGLGDGLHRRGAERIAAHGQVADIVPVDPDVHLPLERLGVKTRGLAEGLADQVLRHAVIDDVVEADLGQRKTQLVRGAFHRAGLAREIGPQIDDGDGFGKLAHSAACG